eukprot:3871397-Lingulodinium_polyedra.AAC.1
MGTRADPIGGVVEGDLSAGLVVWVLRMCQSELADLCDLYPGPPPPVDPAVVSDGDRGSGDGERNA